MHTMKYYSVIKRKKVLIQATTLMNFENIMLSKRRKTQRPNIV